MCWQDPKSNQKCTAGTVRSAAETGPSPGWPRSPGDPREDDLMSDPGIGVTRVAVYIDFDNIVISRYDQVHGRGQFQRDKARGFDQAGKAADPEVVAKLR